MIFKQKRSLSNSIVILNLLFVFLAATTCSKKDDSSSGSGASPIPNTTFGTGYVTPGANEAVLANVPSRGPYDLPLSVSWSFMVDQARMQQTNVFGFGGSIQKTYRGAVAARGTMSVPTTFFAGGCTIPAGTYTLVPLAAGRWTAGVVNVPSFEAVQGDTHVLLSLRNAIIVDPNGDGSADHLAGTLVFRKVSSATQTLNCFASSIYLN